jgi:hypothetical protein
MIVELGVSILFPSIGSVTRHPLPSTGSLESVPPLHRYNEVLGLLALRPASLRCLRSAVPLVRSCSLSRHRARRHEPGLVHRAPSRTSSGNDEASQVPGGPSCTCPALRPRRSARAQPLRRAQCCLPPVERRRLPQLALISGLNHTACTLAVYASQPESPPNHARLATGWWLALAGRDLLSRLVPSKGFSYASSFPRLCLAHSTKSGQLQTAVERATRLSPHPPKT